MKNNKKLIGIISGVLLLLLMAICIVSISSCSHKKADSKETTKKTTEVTKNSKEEKTTKASTESSTEETEKITEKETETETEAPTEAPTENVKKNMDNANEELQELIKEYDIYLENYNSECRAIKEFEQSILANETAVRIMMEDESVSTNPEFVEIYTERLNILRDMYEQQKDYFVALSRSKEEYEEEFQIKKRELEDILRNQENNDEQ